MLECDLAVVAYSCRFDFARGYSGDHVADYCEATAPEFAVAEFWDSLAYRRGVALRNQVLGHCPYAVVSFALEREGAVAQRQGQHDHNGHIREGGPHITTRVFKL
jgi:hypothetical protein